ncbi:microviridin/marinostatin family tricyclic proteinase inhibitor [Sorangium sp. So ce1335]|uniref:microviridin/marinostatin family tricyclic proteinase inhibitor n=1 Tax=Sorangium sp. So ce1335 TaxID=3133335 RepID=UPI003F63DB00
MADIDRDPEQTEQVPFFARFLEDQKRVRTGVKAGGGYTTMKYPSDKEDDGGGTYETHKYPSDSDEDILAK